MIWLIVIGVVVLALAINANAGIGTELTQMQLTKLIEDAIRDTGLDYALVYGVVMTESSGNPNARNPSDPSAGLMGVTPIIGRYYGQINGNDSEVLAGLLDPVANLRAGTRFLAHLRGRYAAAYPVEVWVQAYNLGETLFDIGKRNPEYGNRVAKFMYSRGNI